MSNNDFSEWLAEEMRRRGWSGAELSRRAGITRAQVARLLSGENRPGRDSVRGLATTLAMPMEAIMRQAGLLPDSGELLAEVRDWSARLQALSPGRRRAVIAAMDNVLRIGEDQPARPSPARSAGPE